MACKLRVIAKKFSPTYFWNFRNLDIYSFKNHPKIRNSHQTPWLIGLECFFRTKISVLKSICNRVQLAPKGNLKIYMDISMYFCIYSN